MSQIYKLKLLQKSGLLTELQSNTIFGHFCWRMKDNFGVEKLTEFLKLYKEDNPVFTISNSCFEKNDKIFLANPLLPAKRRDILKEKKGKIEAFLNNKELKNRGLLSLEQFNSAINGDAERLDFLLKEEKFDLPKYDEELRTNVKISRETFSAVDGQLHSYAPMYIERTNENDSINTAVFTKVIDEKSFEGYQCEKLLKEVFDIGFGKKKSSGFGEFEIMDFNLFNEFVEPEQANGFVSLSNYLPSNDDGIKDGFYAINLKYGKLGEELALSSNPFKKPIILFKPGGVFITENKKEYYGRCTSEAEMTTEFPYVIQNGIAFTLRVKI